MSCARLKYQASAPRCIPQSILIVGACLLSFLVYFFTGLAGAEIVVLKLYQPYHRVIGLIIYLLMAVPVWYLLRNLICRFGQPTKAFTRVVIISAMVAFGTPATASHLFNPDSDLGVLNSFEKTIIEVWMPAHRVFIELFGNIRFTLRDAYLLTPEKLTQLREKLRPGDILFMRKDYYLSNIGISGYWKHAAIYVGSLQELDGIEGGDSRFSDDLKREYPKLFRTVAAAQNRGAGLIVESVTKGVLIRPMLESVHADALAVVRPHLRPGVLRKILMSAIRRIGSTYDFRFDYASNDVLYCSEFVCKAFGEPGRHNSLPFGLEIVSGRPVVDPSGMLRALAVHGEFRRGRAELVAMISSNNQSGQASSKSLVDLFDTINFPSP